MTPEQNYVMLQNATFLMEHYGEKHQLIKTMEEMCELGAEIVRIISNDSRASIGKLIEEVADVEVMLLQIRLLYDGFDDLPQVEDIMRYKLERATNEVPVPEIDIADLDPLSDESAEPVTHSGE